MNLLEVFGFKKRYPPRMLELGVIKVKARPSDFDTAEKAQIYIEKKLSSAIMYSDSDSIAFDLRIVASTPELISAVGKTLNKSGSLQQGYGGGDVLPYSPSSLVTYLRNEAVREGCVLYDRGRSIPNLTKFISRIVLTDERLSKITYQEPDSEYGRRMEELARGWVASVKKEVRLAHDRGQLEADHGTSFARDKQDNCL